MVFETKKIGLETLGEYLQEVRKVAGMELEEAATKASMKPQFLALLEEGAYAKLPPDVYMHGFLKSLSKVYGIEAEELILQYRKERSIVTQLAKNHGLKAAKGKLLKHIIITPKVVSIFLGLAFVFLTVVYVIWQVFSINKSPNLQIVEPYDRQLVKGSSARISGKTDPGVQVTVNGQPIFVDSEGFFNTELGLSTGPKDLVFIAKNKFDKVVSKTITIIPDTAVLNAQVKLDLSFTGEVVLEYSLDDQPVLNKRFEAGSTTTLEAVDSITVSVSDAGFTNVSINGKPAGLMGKKGEKLENVTFSPNN